MELVKSQGLPGFEIVPTLFEIFPTLSEIGMTTFEVAMTTFEIVPQGGWGGCG